MVKKLREFAVSSYACVAGLLSARTSEENSTGFSGALKSGDAFSDRSGFVQDHSSNSIRHGLFKETFGVPDNSKRSLTRHAFVFARKLVASLCAFTIGFTPIAYSLAPSHGYAQQIIVDPSAPSTSLFSSGNGTPQVNIATPQSGVSVNKFNSFNVGSDGLVLNNSRTRGTSTIGGSVNANPNLTGSEASVILNEVTGVGTSSLTGTTEVFGGKAAVIIANPNGIGCNGCSFINTNRTTLTTGKPVVNGSQIGLRVSRGTVNIGRGGFTSEGAADVVGRHVLIDGAVNADDNLVVSGGSQQFNYNNATSQAAPILNTKRSLFAVDATEYGALNAGQISIHGNESGLGVNAYGNLNTSGDVTLSSKGDLFYRNVQSGGSGSISADGAVRQYGDAQFSNNVNVSSGSFTLYSDRKLSAGGNVTISSDDYVVVVGEIAAKDISINSAAAITNNGFVLAEGELEIIAGDDISNVREVASEYDVYYDPVIKRYLDVYHAQLLSGDADEAAFASEMVQRAVAHDIIEQYVKSGATLSGRDVLLEANLDIDLKRVVVDNPKVDNAREPDISNVVDADGSVESADIRNIGGAIVATSSIVLRAGANIVNQFLARREKLNAADGCTGENCGYRENFHAGEILSGGNVALTAGLNIENRASVIGAAGTITAKAGRDIVNSLQASTYQLDGVKGTMQISGTRLARVKVCGGGKNYSCEHRYVTAGYTEDTDIFYVDEGNVLAPGQIVTLGGDISLTSGRDFVSIGSEVSAGGDLSLKATGQVILSSKYAVEDDYEWYRHSSASVSCGGKDGNCSTSTSTSKIVTDGRKYVTAASVLQGRDINVKAGQDITIFGGRLLAANDLNLQSTNGSVLIDSTDLPDNVSGAEFADVDFLELDGDAASLLFGNAGLATDFGAYLADNPVLTAVDTLSRTDAGQLRAALRLVGLQGGRSLFADDVNAVIQALEKKIEAVIDGIGDTSGYANLETEIATYHKQYRADVAAVQAMLDIAHAEIDAVMRERLDDARADFNADLQALRDAHNKRLARIEADYRHRRQIDEDIYRNSARTTRDLDWYSDRIQSRRDYKKRRRARELLDYNQKVATRTSQHDTARLVIMAEARAGYEPAAINPKKIAALADFNADLQALRDAHNKRLARIEADYRHRRQIDEDIYINSARTTQDVKRYLDRSQSLRDYRKRKRAQELLDYNQKVATRTSQHDTAKLAIMAELQAGYEPAAINPKIAALKTRLETRTRHFNKRKSALFDAHNAQIAEALEIARSIQDHEAQLNAMRDNAIAKGTAVSGEKSAAVSLTKYANGTKTGYDRVARGTAAGKNYTALFEKTRWRFGNESGLNDLAATPRAVVYAGNDLGLTSGRFDKRQVLVGGEDIYLAGATSVAAGNDLSLNAGRDVGVLGAINTNFGLAANQREAFDFVGKELQLGTLNRAADTVEVGFQLDANGSPVLDAQGNTIRVKATDATEGNLEFASKTRNYRLTNTVLTSGNDLSVNANGDVTSYGGSIVAGENLFITAEGNVNNEALRRNFTLTAKDGCVQKACGREGHDYKQAEVLSGSGLIIASGGTVTNYGGAIGAAGAILVAAEEDIVNEAITSQYLYHYINKSSWFGLKRRKEILRRAIIKEGNISSTYGSVTLDAGRDIMNTASLLSAGGDLTLDAGRDVKLHADSEEVHNFVKRRGFGFLSISQQKTRFNEFGTAFSILEANNIYATAANNLTGTGTIANAASDVVLDAGNNLTFDAHQNLRYRETEGWSFGITFPGSNILAALADGDFDAALDAYIGSNPVLAAVHQLATAENSDQTRSALIGIAITGLQTSAAANRQVKASDGASSFTDALAAQFNPFAGGPLDFTDTGVAPASSGSPDTSGTVSGSTRSFLDGVTFRFSAYQSREEWTESFVTKLTAGQDLSLSAGNDTQLVGGTIATAGRYSDIYAGNDILVAALADMQRSKSSSWGASIGSSGGNVTIGGHAQKASSNAQLFTNAGLTAVEGSNFYSGRNTTFAGANVAAKDVSIYAGRDLVVQSRQNISTSQSSGWNASITFSPAGVPVGFSIGGNQSNANRKYTDTPTTIIGENSLDIYTENNTYLLGAVLNVTNAVPEKKVVSAFDFDGRFNGNAARGLSLNTGQFLFDNLNDVDKSERVSGGISVGLSTNQGGTAVTGVSSFGTTPFAYSYANRKGITFATIGDGLIRVRDVADGQGFDFRDLNRDPNNAQRLIRDKSFEINLPAIELSALQKNLQDAREFFVGLRKERALFQQISGLPQAELEFLAATTNNSTLRRLINSPGFRNYLKLRQTFAGFREAFLQTTPPLPGQTVTYNFDSSGFFLGAAQVADQKFNDCRAAGGSVSACQIVRQESFDESVQIFFDSQSAAGVIVRDITPVVGDITGAAECFESPSIITCTAAVIGIFPAAGDGAKLLIKNGDEVLEISRASDGTVTDIAKASADDAARAGAANTGPRITIRDHYNHHNDMRNDVIGQLRGQGYTVLQREVSFGSSCGTGRCRPDIIYEAPDGTKGIIEIKTGNADLTIRQSEIYPQINSGDAIPRGQVAADFGLDPGIPLRDQGYPNGIPIEIRNFPGVGQ